MKNCKFCGQEMDDELTLCPACNKAQEDTPEEPNDQAAPEEAKEQEAPEAPAAEPVEKPVEAPVEEPAEEQAQEAQPEVPMKKGITGASAIALMVAAVVLLAAILAVLILNDRKPKGEQLPSESASASEEVTEPTQAPTIPADGNPDDVTCKGSYTVTDQEAKDSAAQVVATSGDHSLTNSQFQVHYWFAVRDFCNRAGIYVQYMGLDLTQGLDTQTCAMVEGQTWQQFFLDQALSSWELHEAIYQQAQEAGFQMSEDSQKTIDSILESFADTAKDKNIESAEALCERLFGPGTTLQDYRDFLELIMLSSDYYDQVTSSFSPTDAEVEAFFNAHEAEYADNGLDKATKAVDVRHILILPEGATSAENVISGTFSEEAWAAGEKQAQEILDGWLAGGKTEDSFAALANEHSADAGSNTNGGLYAGVEQGQTVEAFDAWCFDDSRQPGDYGIVKTQYGYHIMYFVGSQTLWQSKAKSDLLDQMILDFKKEALAASEFTVDYSAIRLGLVDMSE